jgi:S1-C subfamily serine protease
MVTDKVYPVIPLGDESTLRVNDTVINVNFADGLGKQISLGRVSTQELVPTRDCPINCTDGFLVQGYGAAGSSGSVVISKKTHKIVGIVVWGFDVNVGMGVEPISRFQTFLQEPTQAHPVDEDAFINAIIHAITRK